MPNPVVAIANIVIGSTTNSNGSLFLYNAAGQQVMQQAILLANGINQYQFNMEQLAKGNYNLIFVQNGTVVQSAKIIKQ